MFYKPVISLFFHSELMAEMVEACPRSCQGEEPTCCSHSILSHDVTVVVGIVGVRSCLVVLWNFRGFS